ncbi:hypothetical protein K5V21_12765 [Clostridium sardiniense]|uniref:Transposase IS30-like HTH domain-containing protein n=1 Tax=Clostridium sardiniense TaxID=29369 RepID=A0ABS7KZT1_CLOSR|nr:helix-turn-helix domain-containing protein [Clostridium sardiniense]MBY0756320.1 hypothetical protein [Clostridium sardiniense]MDQ0461477.1 IS30 family transposase [Clostridium sardiniense]
MIKKGNYTTEEREKIFSMFKSGYTAKEIGNRIGRTKEAIQKEIQKLKKELKNLDKIEKEAEIIRKDRKNELKIIALENSKIISNISLARVCKSAYQVKNSKLILKKGNDYCWDMPNNIDLRR